MGPQAGVLPNESPLLVCAAKFMRLFQATKNLGAKIETLNFLRKINH